VGPALSGRCRCSSKKYMGVHSNDRSRHQGLPQPRYNAFEQRFVVAAAFASIFDTLNFSTFATESARSRHLLQLRKNAKTELLDNLVDDGEDAGRNVEAESLRGLKVYDEIELG
jgi:hypothetical protein